MEIKELFKRPIDRNIQGVIKVDQDDDANVRQELEEYVVTKELQRHFADFFSAFNESLHGPTDDMGVWISGFFGSGKSHFLKIISYILSNRPVNQKPAVDFFDDKINDPMVLNDMHAAAAAKNKVILFNIDAKAKDNSGTDQQSILKVFMQVFNEMQGFTDVDFWIAELERKLTDAGKFDAFKEQISSIDPKHQSWEELRDAYYFNKGTIQAAMVASGYASESNAEGFIEQLSTPYEISIEEFADRVSAYTKKTGNRVIFLADEVGQFIGDSVQRMLNLQTIVEQLGTKTHGKAWVVVTSQQAIDKVTDIASGQDFSKIQGRFKTRIAMSSTNVDEVIRQRLLTKTEPAENLLESKYEANAASINNAIDFDDGISRPKYNSGRDFAQNYPFIPYQFDLLQDVLTAIRENGSEGKHLSEGERSMLSLFQESVEAMMTSEDNVLAPFSLFFEGLDQFLDHTHAIVIQRARESAKVNPDHEDNPFTLQILKVLFMVKYVKKFKATLNNITTLMIDKVDVDRVVLKKRVSDALTILVNQEFVENNLSDKTYEFLTDAEQDITRDIKNQQIESGDISRQISDYLFEGKSALNGAYSYPKLNGRYIFNFDKKIDNVDSVQHRNPLTVHVVTPLDGDFQNETDFLQASSGIESNAVLVALPATSDYIDQVRRALKIEHFVNTNPTGRDERYKIMVDARQGERVQLLKQANIQMTNALDDADVYVGGRKIESEASFKNRLDAAMKLLIDNNYRKLDYINAAKSEKDIQDLFDPDRLSIDEGDNRQALDALTDWLIQENQNNTHVTMTSILAKFRGIPYGYTEEDIEWLLAKLVTDGKLKMFFNGSPINTLSDGISSKAMTEFFTKKQKRTNLAFQVRPEIPANKIKKMREVAAEVFDKKTFDSDNEEQMVSELKAKIQSDLKNLQDFENLDQRFPGHVLLQTGIRMSKDLVTINDASVFYDYVFKNADRLEDWHEDYIDDGIRDFYFSIPQREIWEQGLEAVRNYQQSRDFLSDGDLKEIAKQLETALKSQKLRKETVPSIKELRAQFNELFIQAFDKEAAKYLAEIEELKKRGLDRLSDSGLEATTQEKLKQEFVMVIDRIAKEGQDATTINALAVKPAQARSQLEQLTGRIADMTAKLAVKPPVVKPKSDDSGEGTNPELVTPKVQVKKAERIVKMRQLLDPGDYKLEDSEDIEKIAALFKQRLEAKLSSEQNQVIKLEID